MMTVGMRNFYLCFVLAVSALLAAAPVARAGRTISASDSLIISSAISRERVQIASELVRTATGLIGDEHGEFIWIPDSLLSEWNSFLNRKQRIADPMTVVAPPPVAKVDTIILTPAEIQRQPYSPYESSYVTFRGDTIPRVLKSNKLGRFDRGLFNYLYVPKGMWSFGLTAAYGDINTSDLEMFGLLTGITLHGNIFSISPSMQYFVRNNLAVGLRFNYTRGSASVKSCDISIMDDMEFNIDDVSYKTETYKAAITLRQYLGIEPSARFAVFNDVELAFASGTSDFSRPFDGEMRHNHSTTMAAELNFSPGVSIFVMKNVAFNVSFGVFGFALKNEKQYLNNEYLGSRFKSGADFRFNIFNINFGLSVSI